MDTMGAELPSSKSRLTPKIPPPNGLVPSGAKIRRLETIPFEPHTDPTGLVPVGESVLQRRNKTFATRGINPNGVEFGEAS